MWSRRCGGGVPAFAAGRRVKERPLARPFAKHCFLQGSVSRVRVVPDAVDAAAVTVVGALHSPGLAQGIAARFQAVDVRLVAFLPGEFTVGQRAVLDAVVQALFLVDVALDVRLFHVGLQRIGAAGLRIVLLVVDGVAFAVLLPLDLRALRGRQRTVAQVALLGLVDARLAGFQLARFAGRELSGLQPLLDALLLDDIAAGFACGVVRPEDGCGRWRRGLRERARAKAESDGDRSRQDDVALHGDFLCRMCGGAARRERNAVRGCG